MFTASSTGGEEKVKVVSIVTVCTVCGWNPHSTDKTHMQYAMDAAMRHVRKELA